MTGFFERMAQRAVGAEPRLVVRRRSRFEPWVPTAEQPWEHAPFVSASGAVEFDALDTLDGGVPAAAIETGNAHASGPQPSPRLDSRTRPGDRAGTPAPQGAVDEPHAFSPQAHRAPPPAHPENSFADSDHHPRPPVTTSTTNVLSQPPHHTSATPHQHSATSHDATTPPASAAREPDTIVRPASPAPPTRQPPVTGGVPPGSPSSDPEYLRPFPGEPASDEAHRTFPAAGRESTGNDLAPQAHHDLSTGDTAAPATSRANPHHEEPAGTDLPPSHQAPLDGRRSTVGFRPAPRGPSYEPDAPESSHQPPNQAPSTATADEVAPLTAVRTTPVSSRGRHTATPRRCGHFTAPPTAVPPTAPASTPGVPTRADTPQTRADQPVPQADRGTAPRDPGNAGSARPTSVQEVASYPAPPPSAAAPLSGDVGAPVESGSVTSRAMERPRRSGDSGKPNPVRAPRGGRRLQEEAPDPGSVAEATERPMAGSADVVTRLPLGPLPPVERRPERPLAPASGPAGALPDALELVRDHVVPALADRGVVPSRDRTQVRASDVGRPTPVLSRNRAIVTVGETRTTLSDSGDGPPAAAPTVHVHIDRIDVVRHTPPPAPTHRPLPRVDIDAYLTRRREDR